MIFKQPEVAQLSPKSVSGTGQDNIIIHRAARVRMVVYADKPTKVYVEEIDGLGNPKKSEEFEGHGGFWRATEAFENLVMDRMGIREVDGFEVGMIIEIQQDGKTFKKGDIVVIDEVNADGQATRYTKLNKGQLQRAKNSPRLEKLQKATAYEFNLILRERGMTLDELPLDEPFELGLEPNTEIVAGSQYRELGSGQTKVLPDIAGGGRFTFDKVIVSTNAEGKSMLKAQGFFEDGSIGTVEMRMLFGRLVTILTPDPSQPNQVKIVADPAVQATAKKTRKPRKKSTNAFSEDIQAELEILKNRPYYNSDGQYNWQESQVVTNLNKVQYAKIIDEPLLDLFFVVTKFQSEYGIAVYTGISGRTVEGEIVPKLADVRQYLEDNRDAIINKALGSIQRAWETHGYQWSPRYEGLDSLKFAIEERLMMG